MTGILAFVLTVAVVTVGPFLIAFAITTLLVEGLDLAGLCYSEKREQRAAEREQAQAIPYRLPTGSYVSRGEAYTPVPGAILRRIVKHRLTLQ